MEISWHQLAFVSVLLGTTEEAALTTNSWTNGASFLSITAIAKESNDVRVTGMTGIGKTNALERTAGSAGSFSDSFAPIFTVTDTVGTTTNYLDAGGATNMPAFFYRVRL